MCGDPEERSDEGLHPFSLPGFLSIRLMPALLGIAGLGCTRTPPAPVASVSAPDAARDAETEATPEGDAESRYTGPFEVPFLGERTAFVVAPRSFASPARLLAMLHGVCVPPSYTCGLWTETASNTGFLVCPSGNKSCEPGGPPTWEEPFADMDADLERSISATEALFPGEIDRAGAILAGFSRGSYVAVILAVRHPGRWPFLILNEADVELTVPMMQMAKVRAVALIAGEWGNQLAGERATYEAMKKQGFPIKLWVMPKAAHYYSTDIDDIMRQAIDFVLAHEHDG
jgi:hypothetical protein